MWVTWEFHATVHSNDTIMSAIPVNKDTITYTYIEDMVSEVTNHILYQRGYGKSLFLWSVRSTYEIYMAGQTRKPLSLPVQLF